MSDALLPDDLRTVERLDALTALARDALPGEAVPCFAHLRVETAGRARDLLLGFRTVTEGPVTILHWQTAPLAAVFFATRVGDPYEIEVGGRLIEGTVLARNLLAFDAGALVEVVTPEAVLSRRGDGQGGARWRRLAGPPPAWLKPRAATAPRAPAPWTLAALDDAQRRAVGRPPRRSMLVLGEAGCGKTTVALHRVAALHARAARRGRPFRALVLVPVEGLRRLAEAILARLGAADVEVRVFDRWARLQARRAFPGLPRRESRDAPATVVRLKRHPALRAALPAVAARPGAGATTREDLQHLFGDRELLERVAAASAGAITPHAVRQVLEHTHVQFTETTEAASAHVDADRLATVDGLRIDAGTPFEDAGAIDPEDYAVLFALAALRAPRAPRARAGSAPAAPGTYDCVALDEAQEFAPVELELVGRALRPGGTLVVAGDEGQQVDPTACFGGWAATMRELGARSFETVRLRASYRCPPEVIALARAVAADGPTGDALTAAGTTGDAVTTLRAPSACHLVASLGDGLRDLRASDPAAAVAVVCRTPEAAARTAALLGRAEPVRLVRDGDFRFEAGIDVTCVQEVKGLEFDYVVVPDADATAYPEGAEARRALYVAMTRASHRLVLAAAGSFSPILRAAWDPGRGDAL